MRVDVSWCGFYSEPEPERKASGGIVVNCDLCAVALSGWLRTVLERFTMTTPQPGKGCRGRPRSEHRDRVVELYRHGKRPADIARALKLTRQWVSIILKEAGFDVSSEAQRRQHNADAKFQMVWEASPRLAAAARRLGLTTGQAQARAATLRRAECRSNGSHEWLDQARHRRFSNSIGRDSRPKKSFARRRQPQTGLRGVEATETGGIECRPRVDGEEDAMLAKMPDADVAAQTGRKLKAVAERRWRLRRRKA